MKNFIDNMEKIIASLQTLADFITNIFRQITEKSTYYSISNNIEFVIEIIIILIHINYGCKLSIRSPPKIFNIK